MKYQETMADNLSKAGCSWGLRCQLWIAADEQSGSLTLIEVTVSVSLCAPTKS
jgi:hypothetical protein